MSIDFKRLCRKLGGSYYTQTCEVPLDVLAENASKLEDMGEVYENLIVRGHHECDTYSIEIKPGGKVQARKWGEHGGLLEERELEELEEKLRGLSEEFKRRAEELLEGTAEVSATWKLSEASGTIRGEIVLEVEGKVEKVSKIVNALLNVGVICEAIGEILLGE